MTACARAAAHAGIDRFLLLDLNSSGRGIDTSSRGVGTPGRTACEGFATGVVAA